MAKGAGWPASKRVKEKENIDGSVTTNPIEKQMAKPLRPLTNHKPVASAIPAKPRGYARVLVYTSKTCTGVSQREVSVVCVRYEFRAALTFR